MQIKALVTQLEENQRQMNDALAVCKSAIEANDPSQASYFSLKIEPDFREAKRALDAKPVCYFVVLMSLLFAQTFPPFYDTFKWLFSFYRNPLAIHLVTNRTASVMEQTRTSGQQPNLQPHLMIHKLVVLVHLMMDLRLVSQHQQRHTIHLARHPIHLVIKTVEMLAHMTYVPMWLFS